MSCTDTEREEAGDEQSTPETPDKAPPVLDSAVPGDRLSVLGSAVCANGEFILFFEKLMYTAGNECIQAKEKGKRRKLKEGNGWLPYFEF